ncbi:hypothetical protein NIES267_55120 [Calothrix parasitica NIES-267]|uniref:Uncharacterized protein n=1 Tax=Calothrix parasitica NIES-267 TaxID=1973488 RepID=A0A1Z4LXL8_9CYAN|nr:hypothetical protein NIES267_55120 [Calothrix parasitica NIES-267]
MKVKTVTCKRTRSLENNESETFEMTAELDDNDNVIEASETLENYVRYMLGLIPPESIEQIMLNDWNEQTKHLR